MMIGEIFFIGIAAHICEWQHDDLRLGVQNERRSCRRRRFHCGLGGIVSVKSV